MTQEKLPVSQADRDAAADWCKSQPFPSKQAEGPMIREGSFDHHSLAQAFARLERETLERVVLALMGMLAMPTGGTFNEGVWAAIHAIRALAPEAQHHD